MGSEGFQNLELCSSLWTFGQALIVICTHAMSRGPTVSKLLPVESSLVNVMGVEFLSVLTCIPHGTTVIKRAIQEYHHHIYNI